MDLARRGAACLLTLAACFTDEGLPGGEGSTAGDASASLGGATTGVGPGTAGTATSGQGTSGPGTSGPSTSDPSTATSPTTDDSSPTTAPITTTVDPDTTTAACSEEICDDQDNDCDGIIDELGPANQDLCNYCRRHVTDIGVYDVCDLGQPWASARTFCSARGGDLVAFETADEFSTVLQILPLPDDEYWLGLSDAGLEGQFEWVTKTPLDWMPVPWAETEPNGGEQEDCVLLYKNAGATNNRWGDTHCGNGRQTLCELASG